MALWIARALLSFVLGLTVFLALVVFLVITGLRGTLAAEPYLQALDQAEAYERIYGQVLTTDLVDSIRPELAYPLTLLTSEEILELLRTVAPPKYLKGQVEENLSRMEGYFSGDAKTLRLYVNLAEPMDRISPEVATMVETRISSARSRSANEVDMAQLQDLPSVLGPSGGLAGGSLAEGSLAELLDQYEIEIEQAMVILMSGKPVSSTVTDLTDLTGLSREEALAIFEMSMDRILASPEIDEGLRSSLAEARPVLREAFATGNTFDFLSAVVDASLEPAIDLALAETRPSLDEKGRIDLVPLLAADLLIVEEAQLQASLRRFRDGVRSFLSWGTALAAGAVLLAMSLAAVLFRWKIDAVLRWLYVTLVLAGTAAFATVLMAYLLLPAGVEAAIYELLSEAQHPLPSLAPLASEVSRSFVAAQLRDLMWMAGLPAVAGIAIWAATRAVPSLRTTLRPKEQTSLSHSQQDRHDD